MKPFLLLPPAFLIFINTALAQGVCSNMIIASPVVARPSGAGIASASCTALVVQWNGTAGATYLVTATFMDPVTHQLTPTAPATHVSCDNSRHCTATIPVTAGTRVSWSVQAAARVEDRTFYSYPMRGAQHYAVPACLQPVMTVKSPGASLSERLMVSNEKLALYPNPVTDAIHVQWNSAYRGKLQWIIVDVSGKVVKVMNDKKEQPEYTNNIPVCALTAGLYFVEMKVQHGPSLTARFVKN